MCKIAEKKKSISWSSSRYLRLGSCKAAIMSLRREWRHVGDDAQPRRVVLLGVVQPAVAVVAQPPACATRLY